MNPDTRRLVRLTVEPGDDTDKVIDMLLARGRAADRRAWLEEKGNLAEV
jgi:topoisomerase-4 subunit B